MPSISKAVWETKVHETERVKRWRWWSRWWWGGHHPHDFLWKSSPTKNESERQYLSSLTAFLLSALFASLLKPGMFERHVRTTLEQEKIPKTIESIVFSFSCLESTWRSTQAKMMKTNNKKKEPTQTHCSLFSHDVLDDDNVCGSCYWSLLHFYCTWLFSSRLNCYHPLSSSDSSFLLLFLMSMFLSLSLTDSISYFHHHHLRRKKRRRRIDCCTLSCLQLWPMNWGKKREKPTSLIN